MTRLAVQLAPLRSPAGQMAVRGLTVIGACLSALAGAFTVGIAIGFIAARPDGVNDI